MFSTLVPSDRVRLNAYSAPNGTKWFGAAPSSTLDKDFASHAFVTSVALQLGVDVRDDVLNSSFVSTLRYDSRCGR